MKHHIFFLLLLSITFSSCNRVVFEKPQPERARVMASFPKMYHGTYSNPNLEISILKNSVSVNGYTFQLAGEKVANGQLQMRFAQNFFFANFPDPVDSTKFIVIMAQFLNDQLAVYMLNPDRRSLSRIQRVSTVEHFDLFGKTVHVVRPHRNLFQEIVDQEMFDVVGVLKKQ
jgi:hypothetical protein